MVPELGLEPQYLSASHDDERFLDISYPAFVRRAGFEPRDLQVTLVFFHPFGLSELPPQEADRAGFEHRIFHNLSTVNALTVELPILNLFDQREVRDLLPNQGSVTRHDADSHQLTIPGSIGLSDDNVRDILFLELLFEPQKIKFTTSTQRNRASIRRKIARAALASRVNQLGAKVAEWNIQPTNAVVVEDKLDRRSRSVVRS